MAHVITLVGCASGVGVTTTAQALACALQADNKTVRCIDTSRHITPYTSKHTDYATHRSDIESLVNTHASNDYIIIDTDGHSAPLVAQLGHPVVVLATPDPNHLHALDEHASIHGSGASPLLGIVIVRTTDDETPQARKVIASVIDLQLRNSCRILSATIGDNGPEARRFRRDSYQSISGPLQDDWFALSDELTDLVFILADRVAKTPDRPRGGVGCPIGINNLTIDPHNQAPSHANVASRKIRKSLYLPEDLIERTKRNDTPIGDQIVTAVARHRRALLSAPLPKPNHNTTSHRRTRAYLSEADGNDLEELADNLDAKLSHVVAQALRLELGSG